jgi:hypothetical protein
MLEHLHGLLSVVLNNSPSAAAAGDLVLTAAHVPGMAVGAGGVVLLS